MDNASRILTYVVIFLLFQLAGPPSLSNEQLKAVATYLGIVRAELDTLANVTLSDFAEKRLALSALNFTNVKEFSPDQPQRLHPPSLEKAVDALWSSNSSKANSSVYMHPNAKLKGEVSLNASLETVKLPLPIFKAEEPLEWTPIMQPAPVPMLLQLHDNTAFEEGEARVVLGTASFVPLESHLGPLPLLSLPVRGIYLNSGRFVLSTSTLKYQGSAVLPYVLGCEDARLAMLEFLNATAPDQIDVYDAWQALEDQKSQALEAPEFIIYGQASLDDRHSLSEEELTLIENELAHPEGAPLPEIPQLSANVVLWSPDSGLNGVAQDASGMRTEVLLARRHRVLLGLLGIYMGLTALTAKVSLQLASPSKSGKFSLWTAALMALMDAATCINQALSSDGYGSQLSLAIALFAFVLTIWFELDLVTRIYTAHANESALVEYQRQHDAEGDQTDSDEPRAQQTFAEYVGEREISGRVYGRFYLALFALTVLTAVFGHTQASRYRYEAVMLILFYSCWAPQIWRSASKGSQVPLSTSLMVSISALRLLPVLYVCLVKNNSFDHHYRPLLSIIIVLWQSVQLTVLTAQRKYGPRFFLPRSWAVEGYDYHRLLTDDIEQQDTMLTAPRASGQDSSELEFNEELQSSCRIQSCAICMESITLPIHRGGPVTPALEGERQKYMITPCRHVFHTECLEQWMESKLQCPVCRSPLPAI